MTNKPRCETCPFYTDLENGFALCRYDPPAEVEAGMDIGKCTGPADWCRHHPDAPKPFIETVVLPVAEVSTRAGWVPVGTSIHGHVICWREVWPKEKP